MPQILRWREPASGPSPCQPVPAAPAARRPESPAHRRHLAGDGGADRRRPPARPARPRRAGRAPVGAGDQRRAQRGRVHPRADGPPHPLRGRAAGLLLRPALLRRRRGLPHRRAVRRLRLLPPAGRRPGRRRLAAARPGHLLPRAAPGRAHRRPARRPPGGRRPADHGQALRQQRGRLLPGLPAQRARPAGLPGRRTCAPPATPGVLPRTMLFSLLAGVLWPGSGSRPWPCSRCSSRC